MFKHNRVQAWDINYGQDGDESRKDAPKKELITPDVVCPLHEWIFRLAPHTKEGAPHMHHFPCEDEREPGETCEGRGTSAEDEFTAGVVRIIAALSQLTVAEAEYDEGEGSETESSHVCPVDNYVDEQLLGHDTNLDVMRRAGHDIVGGRLHAQAHCRETRRDHDDPQYFDGRKRESRKATFVPEGESDEESASLCDVLSEQVQNKFLDVVECTSPFVNCVDDTGEVVIRQDNIRSVFCDVRSGHAHSDADVGALECWTVIHTITCHGNEFISPVEGFHHADF